MQDIIEQIRSYLLGIWRYRWYMLAVAWLICLVSWPFIFKLPNQYQASARVSVDVNTAILKELGIPEPTDIQTRLKSMPRVLLSQSNLEEIVRDITPALKANEVQDPNNLITWVRSGLRINGGERNSNNYQIAFAGENPQLAKSTVQAALDLFRKKVSTVANEHFDKTERFLKQEIAEKEAKNQELQDQLTTFQAQNIEFLPRDGRSYLPQLDQAKADLAKAKLELEKAEKRRDSYLQDLKGDRPTFGGAGLPIIPPATSRSQTSSTPANVSVSILSFGDFKRQKRIKLSRV